MIAPHVQSTASETAEAVLARFLSCALNGSVPEEPACGWADLHHAARSHGLASYLYSELVRWFPQRFGRAAPQPETTAPCWREAWLLCATDQTRTLLQARELLAALAGAGIPTVPLKGLWLSTRIYDDPVRRPMSDLDLLIRRADLDAARQALAAVGYACRKETFAERFANDLSFVRPRAPKHVELHWDFACDRVPLIPRPDVNAIWSATRPTEWNGVPCRELSDGDQLAHLCHHILHHLFQVPLRNWLDIALFLQARREALTRDSLTAAAARWRIPRAMPLMLRAAIDLFAVTRSDQMAAFTTHVATERLAELRQLILTPPATDAMRPPPAATVAALRHAGPLRRLALLANRIFIPRDLLCETYPAARWRLGLPLAWCQRAADLLGRYRHTLGRALSETEPDTVRRHTLAVWALGDPREERSRPRPPPHAASRRCRPASAWRR